MRQRDFKELVERSQQTKAIAKQLIVSCLKVNGHSTPGEIVAYMEQHIKAPSGTAISIVREHPTNRALVEVLLRTLTDEGVVTEVSGGYIITPPRTLDSDWTW